MVFFQALLEGIARGRGARLRGSWPSWAGRGCAACAPSAAGPQRGLDGHTRSGLLGVPLLEPRSVEAAYGTALLARKGAIGG